MAAAPDFRSLSIWERLAVWLGFLAVAAALIAPVTLLAEDVQTGKLGGICSLNAASAGDLAAGDDSAPPAGSHCDWCLSVALAPLLLLAAALLATAPRRYVSVVASPVRLAGFVVGLPFSRGPPAL